MSRDVCALKVWDVLAADTAKSTNVAICSCLLDKCSHDVAVCIMQPFILVWTLRSLYVLDANTGNLVLEDHVDGDISDVKLSTYCADGPGMIVVANEKRFKLYKECADSRWNTKSLSRHEIGRAHV